MPRIEFAVLHISCPTDDATGGPLAELAVRLRREAMFGRDVMAPEIDLTVIVCQVSQKQYAR